MTKSYLLHCVVLASFLGISLFGCGDSTDPPPNGDTVDPPEDSGESVDTDDPKDTVDPPEAKTLVINEIAAANQHGPDWIELYNAGEEAINTTGWSITDNVPEHISGLPLDIVIQPGEYLLLQGGNDGSFNFGVGAADSLFLYGAGGGVIDETAWSKSDAPAGTTWGRYPNGTGDFGTLSFPTPGYENALSGESECGNDIIEGSEKCDGDLLSNVSCENLGYSGGNLACANDCLDFDTSACTTPAPGIVINEVTSTDNDFIELFNSGNETVDLSGWTVTDQSPDTEGHSHGFANGTMVAPDTYLLLFKGEDHLFGLASNDKVQLFDGEGNLVDNANYGPDEAEISYCRIPNGTGTFTSCDAATPGAEN